MQLLFVLFFATQFQLELYAKHVKDNDEEIEDDIFELPPDQRLNPVVGFALSKFIELDLHIKYDLTLLQWFGGSTEECWFQMTLPSVDTHS